MNTSKTPEEGMTYVLHATRYDHASGKKLSHDKIERATLDEAVQAAHAHPDGRPDLEIAAVPHSTCLWAAQPEIRSGVIYRFDITMDVPLGKKTGR